MISPVTTPEQSPFLALDCVFRSPYEKGFYQAGRCSGVGVRVPRPGPVRLSNEKSAKVLYSSATVSCRVRLVQKTTAVLEWYPVPGPGPGPGTAGALSGIYNFDHTAGILVLCILILCLVINLGDP